MATPSAMSKIESLQVNYRGIQAAKGVDLEVAQRVLVTLIGANVGGKTTTMKAITRLKPYSAGVSSIRGNRSRVCPSMNC